MVIMNETRKYYLMNWFYLLAYCNSGMNFIIYSVKNPDFKHSLLKLLKVKANSIAADGSYNN
mgnify:CR=1 FL=1